MSKRNLLAPLDDGRKDMLRNPGDKETTELSPTGKMLTTRFDTKDGEATMVTYCSTGTQVLYLSSKRFGRK